MSRRHLKRYRIEWRVRPKRIGWGVISDFDRFLDCVDKGYDVAQKAVIGPLIGKKDAKGLYERKWQKYGEFKPIGKSRVFVVDDVGNDFSTISVYELDNDGCYNKKAPIAELVPTEMGVCKDWYVESFLGTMWKRLPFKSASVPFGACSQDGEDWIAAGFTLQLGGRQVFEKESLNLVNGYFNTLAAHEGEGAECRCVQAFQLAYKGHILDANKIPGSINGVFHAFVGVVHPDGETKFIDGKVEDEETGETKIGTCAQDPGFIITMSAKDLTAADFDELDRLTHYEKKRFWIDDGEVDGWQFNNPDPETVETVKPRKKSKRGQRDETLNDEVESDEEEELGDIEYDDVEADSEDNAEEEEVRLSEVEDGTYDEEGAEDVNYPESDVDEDCEEDEEVEVEEDGANVDKDGEETSEKRRLVFMIIGVLFGWAGLHFLYAKKIKSMYLSLTLLLWAVVEYFLERPINFTAAPYSALRFQFALIFVGLLWFLSVCYCEKDGNGRTMT